MNKQEYKLLSEEIMTLTANEQFQDAAEIADRIDWRKVRSFSMLMKISELYQLNRRYEDALELMLLAYDHNPKNRDIVYGLCELYILLGVHVKALEFMALYKRMAPNDPGVYILQYKLQELEGASTEDQIQLLEEFTRKDYREEWVYQLAYLYHRIGLGTKCVETCDDLLNWFKEGPFVIKTLELKMLHAKLKPEQQAIYDHRDDIAEEIQAVESDEYTAESPDPGLNPEMNDVDFHVKTIDMGKFNTINLQKALAESMRELMGAEDGYDRSSRGTGRMKTMMEDDYMSTGEMERQMAGKGAEELEPYPEEYPEEGYEGEYPEEGYEGEYPEEGYEGEYPEEGYEGEYPEEGYEGEYPEEGYEGEYPEEGYEGEYPEEGYEEGYPEEEQQEQSANGTYAADAQVGDNYAGAAYEEDPIESVPGELASEPEGVEDQTIYFRPGDIPAMRGAVQNKDEVFFEDRTDDIVIDSLPSNTNPEYESVLSKARAVQMEEIQERRERANMITPDVETRSRRNDKPGLENMFYLGDDGQLGLAVRASTPIEKQITGQISMNDYMAEWERTKMRKRAQQGEELQRSIMERTGPIFKDFDERRRNGLIEELEREQKIFKDKYQADDIELRSIEEIGSDEPEQEYYPEEEEYTDEAAYAEESVQSADEVTEVTAPEAAAEPEGSVDVMAEPAPGRSIWDEVEEAMEADKKISLGMVDAAETAAAEMIENAADVHTGSGTGTIGLVDAAVSGSSGLADTKDYGIIREITAEKVMADDEPEEEYYGDEEYPDEYFEEGVYEDGEYAEGEYPDEYYEDEEYYEDGEYPEAGYEDEGYDEAEGYGDEDLTADEDGYGDEDLTADEDGYGDEDEAVSDGYDDEPSVSNTDNLASIVKQLKDTTDDGQWGGGGMNTAQISEISGALEADADRVGHETVDEMNDEFTPEDENELSTDEQKLFADFLYSKKMRSQLLEAIDKISLAAYVGNAIVTGENEEDAVKLAKNLIKEIQMIDSNFVSTRIAKISGVKMNHRDIPLMLNQLGNGALLVDHASDMNRETLETIAKTLESMPEGLFIVMTDKRKGMDRMLEEYEMITGYFNARVDIAAMNNNALVEYAKKYAYSLEYKIDEERGVLALHQRISELQIGEHNVTTREVEDLIDEAIEHSKRKKLAAYFQILGGKRYDYEDMIILREKDFLGK